MKKLKTLLLVMSAILSTSVAASDNMQYSLTHTNSEVSKQSPTIVTDVGTIAELKNIESILIKILENKNNEYTCTDGEKRYTVGMRIKKDSYLYRCIITNDHTEWFIE